MATDYLTPDEVASQLQVSRQVVYNWINDGRLRAVKAGRTLRIPHYALDAFLEPVHAGDISTGSVSSEPAMHFDRFTSVAQSIATAAGNEMQTRQHIEIEVEHVLWALVRQPDGIAQVVLKQLGVDPDQLMQQLDQALAKLPKDPTFPHSTNMMAISARVANMIQRAEELASLKPDLQIDTSHLLQAICDEADGVSAQLLHSFGATPERLRAVLLEVRATHPAAAPQAATPRSVDWEQRIEQQLTRIETELAAIRSMLPELSSGDTTG
jgi:excisionase family DNA binding protein